MTDPFRLFRSCVLAALAARLLAADGDLPSIVPAPLSMTRAAGVFASTAQTSIVAAGDAAGPARLLAGYLRPITGEPLPISPAAAAGTGIHLVIGGPSTAADDEGYHLAVTPTRILIRAPRPAGLINGVQTLRQLLPPTAYGRAPGQTVASTDAGPWTVPCVTIDDRPQFRWRGMMLDVSRQFLDKAYVLHYLDVLAAHKINVLHLHCIDDAGWRIAIAKYPRLTEVGAFRGTGASRKGGFYTADDVREMVAYAAERNIAIVPEVELPAHTLPAIIAYPELGCRVKKLEMPTTHFISEDLYCAGKDTTVAFIKDVLDEICALFPSKYLHIGGDEAKYGEWKACADCQRRIATLGLKGEKELQGWLTCEVERHLAAKGRSIIGWDEILECGVSPTAGIMPWHNAAAGPRAALAGHPVVMALTRHCYFDTVQSRLPGEPAGATWTPPVTLQAAYDWDPLPAGLPASAVASVLGAQGCLWTDMFLHRPDLEAMGSGEYCDYFTLPRLSALAEVTWTPRAQRDWQGFQRRMARQYLRYEAAGWNYRVPPPEVRFRRRSDGALEATATSPIEGGSVHATTDGSDPTRASPRLDGPLVVAREEDLRAISVPPSGTRQSLVAQVTAADPAHQRLGARFGAWTSGAIGSRTPRTVDFPATGLIDGDGTYEITFVYTGGAQRLDIDQVEVVRNQDTVVGSDVHHGFTGSASQANTYVVRVAGYETGAAFVVRARIYGDTGDDSNGLVFIRKR